MSGSSRSGNGVNAAAAVAPRKNSMFQRKKNASLR
jgi:hypothetical protein